MIDTIFVFYIHWPTGGRTRQFDSDAEAIILLMQYTIGSTIAAFRNLYFPSEPTVAG